MLTKDKMILSTKRWNANIDDGNIKRKKNNTTLKRIITIIKGKYKRNENKDGNRERDSTKSPRNPY